ncbi:MAG: M12 family metallo-peptidase [Moheibacter sp.]
MKKLGFLIFLIFTGFAFGQVGSVSQKVQELMTAKRQFNSYELFTKSNDNKTAKYMESATDVTVLNMNSSELSRIVDEAPELITISVPYQNKEVAVKMYKHNVLTDNFFATDESGNILNYTPGQYYRGIVDGDYTSLVAISFFENDVIGVISTFQDGNIVLGKSADQQDYITYSDVNLMGENPFSCGVDDLEYNQQIMDHLSFDPSAAPMAPNTNRCVKIYYEIGYKPFVQKARNIQATIDWITGIQNNIGTLYDNDDIDMALSQVRIWTYADPYTGSYSQNLDNFRTSGVQFDADLAHLVNYPSTTSVAYLDSICTNYNFAYSGINMTYAQVPTYSWTIMAMTHEMGHALGSPHTHACAWNGNGTAIDGCGPAAGYSEGCNGPIPSEGGTIMSYCHLISGVGINFNLGFGPQPGELIRTTVDSKSCLGTDCTGGFTTCTYAIKSLTATYLNLNDIQVDVDDESSDLWNYKAVPFGEDPGTNGWTSTTSTTFNVTGLQSNKYYEIYVVNICADGSAGIGKKVLVLTGGFCDGTLFTDTGGESGNYGVNQHFVKTFYPNVTGEKVKLSFDKIGLQTNSDYMYVHDGDSLSDPLFANGTITGNNNPGPEFTSTHSSGAITIEFVSDGVGVAYGWEGHIDCGALGISEVSDINGITVYPNPTTDVLNIVSQKSIIESVILTDASGRRLMTTELKSQNGQLNIGHLPAGVYILNMKVNGKMLTKKIVKK